MRHDPVPAPFQIIMPDANQGIELDWSARSKIVIQPRLADASNKKATLIRPLSVFKSASASSSKVSSPTPSMPVALARNVPELHKPVGSSGPSPTTKPDNAKTKHVLPSRTEAAVMAIHKKAKRIEEGGIKKASQKASEAQTSSIFLPRRVRVKNASPSILNATPADRATNSENVAACTVSNDMEVDIPSLTLALPHPNRPSSGSPIGKLTSPLRRPSLTTRPSALAQTIAFDCRQSSPSTSSDESDASSKDTPPPMTPPAFHASFSPTTNLQPSRYLTECTNCSCTKNDRPRCQRCEILQLSDRFCSLVDTQCQLWGISPRK